MATNASVILKFSDGTMSYLRNDITVSTTASSLQEVLTDASGILNIAGGISAGQANQGKLLTHAGVKIQEDNATTGAFGHGAVYGVQGQILSLIQGGGSNAAGLPALKTPVRMTTGISVKVMAQTSANEVQIASCAVYCASGKADIFSTLMVDGTQTALLNKDGNTLGEALSGEMVVCTYTSYPAQFGLADVGVADGINALYVESAQGVLKAMMYTNAGGGHVTNSDATMIPFVDQPFRIVQNDNLFGTANV
tara:strand:+ start:430 stop:1185 length:756 start_codon:yes stop_codon:yes gene_type:complete